MLYAWATSIVGPTILLNIVRSNYFSIKTLPKFSSMPTKQWSQVEVGNEIVIMHLLVRCLSVICYCDGQYGICLWYGIVMVSMIFVCDMILWWSVSYLSLTWYSDGMTFSVICYSVWYLYVIWYSDGVIFVYDMVLYNDGQYGICLGYGIMMVYLSDMV